MAEASGQDGVDSTPVNDHDDRPKYKSFEDRENADLISLDFELSDEEDCALSYYPSELDFYDQKRGQILRRNGGKKGLSAKTKAKKNCPENDQAPPSSSKYGGQGGCSGNKELRIKEMRTENSKRKKVKKTKTRKETELIQDRSVARAGKNGKIRDPRSCLKKSVHESCNQPIKPPSFYNNSDFILGSGNSVKFDDQAFMNLLIELQNREITPEDYDLLVQLDCSVKPKTLSKDQIDSLRSDTVTSVLDDVCSICIEDYTPGEERQFLPCGHYFHGQCIQTWLSWTSNRCPIDGKELS